MRISDWSSDVCSSDLTARCGGVWRGVSGVERAFAAAFRLDAAFRLRLYNTCSAGKSTTLHEGRCCKTPSPARRPKLRRYDRPSVVSGKRVSGRVDLGGRLIIQKNNTMERNKKL